MRFVCFQWICSLCYKPFNRKSALTNHLRAVHKIGKSFRCPTCGREDFSSYMTFYKHKKTCTVVAQWTNAHTSYIGCCVECCWRCTDLSISRVCLFLWRKLYLRCILFHSSSKKWLFINFIKVVRKFMRDYSSLLRMCSHYVRSNTHIINSGVSLLYLVTWLYRCIHVHMYMCVGRTWWYQRIKLFA